MRLQIKREEEKEVAVYTLKGHISFYTAQRLKDTLEKEKNAFVVLELSGVRTVDSSGIGLLVTFLKRMRERGGDLRFSSPSSYVRKVLDFTNLSKVFKIFEDKEGAIESFRKKE
jgi:anti-anti-sigma factor